MSSWHAMTALICWTMVQLFIFQAARNPVLTGFKRRRRAACERCHEELLSGECFLWCEGPSVFICPGLFFFSFNACAAVIQTTPGIWVAHSTHSPLGGTPSINKSFLTAGGTGFTGFTDIHTPLELCLSVCLSVFCIFLSPWVTLNTERFELLVRNIYQI